MSGAIVEISDDAIYQTLEDEVVLLNMASQRYFGLNDVGSEMWKLLIEHRDVEAVALRLSQNYGVDVSRVQADLDELVRKLTDVGLLKPVAAAQSST